MPFSMLAQWRAISRGCCSMIFCIPATPAFAITHLILGMLIDPIAVMVMTLPVMSPIMVGSGYDPIWLGVIAIKLAEISLITPPVGLNVYVVRSASPLPLEDVFTGVTSPTDRRSHPDRRPDVGAWGQSHTNRLAATDYYDHSMAREVTRRTRLHPLR